MTDRLIQQALLQALQPLLDPHFSEHSYGYRPGRGAQDAVLAAQSCVQAGARVMDGLRSLFGRLKLSLNEDKSVVRSAFGCVVLGFTFWVAPVGVVKRRVATASLGRFEQRVRDLTRRSGGRSLPAAVDRLRNDPLGWTGYYRLAQTPTVWRELDGWVRHRVRAIPLKQCKQGPTIQRALLARGLTPTSRDG